MKMSSLAFVYWKSILWNKFVEKLASHSPFHSILFAAAKNLWHRSKKSRKEEEVRNIKQRRSNLVPHNIHIVSLSLIFVHPSPKIWWKSVCSKDWFKSFGKYKLVINLELRLVQINVYLNWNLFKLILVWTDITLKLFKLTLFKLTLFKLTLFKLTPFKLYRSNKRLLNQSCVTHFPWQLRKQNKRNFIWSPTPRHTLLANCLLLFLFPFMSEITGAEVFWQ